MPTIAGIATGNSDFSILVSALQYLDEKLHTELVATLSDEHADLTVFAPTNTAFANLAVNLGYHGDPHDFGAVTGFLVDNVPAKTLLDIVLYHVSPTTQLSGDVASSDKIMTLNGAKISPDLPTLVDKEPDLIDPSLISVDNIATNGVVHIIDQVLLPIDLPGNDAPSITDIVAASGKGFDGNKHDFDILLAAVKAAGLANFLDDKKQDLTAFAPKDAAFIDLAQTLGFHGHNEKGAWNFLVQALTDLGGGDPIPLLTEILTYHVAGESLQASQVLSSKKIETLQGGKLGVDGAQLVDADPDISNPNIVATDIQAENGVVHVIDGVLLPVDLMDSDDSDDGHMIVGNNHKDDIRTGKDDDYVDGKGGDDYISTGKGDDVAYGGNGADRIYGRRDDDELMGQNGHDKLYGGHGEDELKGGNGHDMLHGSHGADELEGGNGRDILRGGNGDDKLEGGQGNDKLHGGHGEDVFVFHKGDDRDHVTGFKADEDKIDLSSYDMSYDDIAHAIHREKGGTMIDLGDGDSMYLAGTMPGHIDEDNFIF